MSCLRHSASMPAMSGVRSRKVHDGKPPVWFESTALGSAAHSTPHAETSGSATVAEHCPTQETSWMVRSRFGAATGSLEGMAGFSSLRGMRNGPEV